METAEPRVYRTFYGGYSSNTAGYCYKHYLSLTPRQIMTRGCLGRECPAFQRHQHLFWTQRDSKKTMRRARKDRLEALYRQSAHIEE